MKSFVALVLGAALALSAVARPLEAIAQGTPVAAPAPVGAAGAPAAPNAPTAAAAATPTAAPPTSAESKRSALGDRRMQMTEAVTAADFKKIDGGPLLLAAYGVVWLVFFVLLLYTFVRMRRVGDELRRLEAQLRASKVD